MVLCLNDTTIYISRTTNFKNNRHPCHRSHRRHGRHRYRRHGRCHHRRKAGMIVPVPCSSGTDRDEQ